MQRVTAKEFMKFIENQNPDEISIKQHIAEKKKIITTRKGRNTIARNVLIKNMYGHWIGLHQIEERS